MIDADSLLFAAGFAVEKKRYTVYSKLEDGTYLGAALFSSKKELNAWMKEHNYSEEELEIESETVLEPFNHACQAMDYLVNAILDNPELGMTSYQMYLSGEGNFRKLMETEPLYKGNRDPNHRPTYEKDLFDYLVRQYGAEVVNGMEADDAVGIAQFQAEPETTIIVSIDKDLNMIPGWHYNYQKKSKYLVTKEDADRFFWTQMLTGDTADNVRGIYNVGPVTAAKMLQGVIAEDYANVVWDAYIQEFQDDAERIYRQNQELLWILREPRSYTTTN